MAADFIGYNVLVTLRAPPDATVEGEVADVIGQRLMLRNVSLSWINHPVAAYSIEAPDIADLSLGPVKRPASQTLSTTLGERNVAQIFSGNSGNQSFVDPAILSFSKPTQNQQHQVTPPQYGSIDGIGSQKFVPQQKAARDQETTHSTPIELLEPFSNLELSGDNTMNVARDEPGEKGLQASAKEDLPTSYSNTQFDAKRGRQASNLKDYNQRDAAFNTNPKSKGWRQTAFVEPASPNFPNSPQTYRERVGQHMNGKRRRKKGKGGYAEQISGWATEDATDIQEMGDFDFQSNLSKFDKRRVFEEIRNDDTTADEDRLVSFNRRAPKPGTNGGKNLHWTENVLDSPEESDNVGSDQEPSDAKLSSGNYSGRDLSRVSARQGSRKGSAILGQPLVPAQLNTIGRSQLSNSRTTSPLPTKTPVSASPIGGPGVPGATLRLITTNRSCPTVSPLQILEVEQIAVAEFGLTEDTITENTGRSIAEAAVGLLSNDAAAPTMLVLTGNHRTGARAVSAARHLRNRGHRVTVCMLGIEHENELLESCRKQLEVFKKIGGRVLRWEDLSTRLAASDLGPDLVLDALFGIHVAFDDLRTDDRIIAFEMISWANRSNLDILSVDVPSGLSATSGEVTMVEGGRLCVNAKSIVCLGAPKSGIVNALFAGEGESWNLSVADIGIPQIVWRKYGTRRRHGIDFGNRWVVPLRYQPSTA